MVPLLVAQLLHLTSAGTWASLGGFSVAIADRGGAYRIRATTMGALTIGAALGAAVGALAGANAWVAVAVTFVLVATLSLAREFGISAGGVGNSIAVAFAISLAIPATTVSEALLRGAFLIAGGLWAMLLALVFWPVRPYRPLRLATARCYRELAGYARDVADLEGKPPNDTQQLLLDQRKRVVREAIETARAIVAVARRGGQGEARRGERLLILVQGAELLFGTLIAVSELLASAAEEHAVESSRRMARALAAFADASRRIALTVETEPAPPLALASVSQILDRSPVVVRGEEGSLAVHASRLLAQLEEGVTVMAANADALESGRVPAIPPALAVLTIVDDRPPVLETLRASLTLSSLALRHALRVAIVTAVAVLLARLLNLPRGYWVTITVLIILQPFVGTTLIKTLQRVVGTVAGALLTASLVALVHDPRGLLVIVFVFAAVCVAYLRVNYLIYSIFLTPTFVLLAEMSAGDWHLAQLRAVNTMLGAALALAGSWLLWPTPERDRFPELAAAVLRAIASHLRVLTTMWSTTDEESSVALATARRDVALALTNAEASLERMVAESATRRRELEPGTTLVTFARRLVAADIALGTLRHAPEAAAIRRDVQLVADRLTTALDCVADAVAARRSPDGCGPPPLPESSHPDLTVPQFRRVLRQFEIIVAAAKRLAVS
jgi:uncharacterized membrane protein YccC